MFVSELEGTSDELGYDKAKSSVDPVFIGLPPRGDDVGFKFIVIMAARCREGDAPDTRMLQADRMIGPTNRTKTFKRYIPIETRSQP